MKVGSNPTEKNDLPRGTMQTPIFMSGGAPTSHEVLSGYSSLRFAGERTTHEDTLPKKKIAKRVSGLIELSCCFRRFGPHSNDPVSRNLASQ
jgi:hypothetical protein